MGSVENPASTHLNIAATLSKLGRHSTARLHPRVRSCAFPASLTSPASDRTGRPRTSLPPLPFGVPAGCCKPRGTLTRDLALPAGRGLCRQGCGAAEA